MGQRKYLKEYFQNVMKVSADRSKKLSRAQDKYDK